MEKLSEDDKNSITNKLFRLELGEAWMWCSDCMSKLYSFDGTEDDARKCPHPTKCEEDRRRLNKK
jgi:hypothetical protein